MRSFRSYINHRSGPYTDICLSSSQLVYHRGCNVGETALYTLANRCHQTHLDGFHIDGYDIWYMLAHNDWASFVFSLCFWFFDIHTFDYSPTSNILDIKQLASGTTELLCHRFGLFTHLSSTLYSTLRVRRALTPRFIPRRASCPHRPASKERR